MKTSGNFFSHILSFLVLTFISGHTQADEVVTGPLKGDLFVNWGWNRAWYSNSDIHFKGEYYNFVLSDVVAHDRQTPLSWEVYGHLDRLTIPQVNFRAGYFLTDHYYVSGGFDHMKYVVSEGQTVPINGEIHEPQSVFNGVYSDTSMVLKWTFLRFEHTNGLNYINVAAGRQDHLRTFHVPLVKTLDVRIGEAVGFGILRPKSDVKLMRYREYDHYHIAGYGIDLKAALQVTFGKHFFLSCEAKGGYINMPDIRTTEFESDRASQHFVYIQTNFNFGVIFNLYKQKQKTG